MADIIRVSMADLTYWIEVDTSSLTMMTRPTRDLMHRAFLVINHVNGTILKYRWKIPLENGTESQSISHVRKPDGIKILFNAVEQEEKPVQVTCSHCGSILEVTSKNGEEIEEEHIDPLNPRLGFTCPVCKKGFTALKALFPMKWSSK